MIELMIAMLIGILLLGPLAVILSNNSRTRYDIENSVRQIQSARYALQILTDEIGNAGFYGEARIQSGGDLPSPCLVATDITEDVLSYPIQGEGNLATKPESCSSMDAFFQNSDLIVVRRASTCAVGQPGCDTLLAGLPHIQQPACPAAAALIIGTELDAFTGILRPCDAAVPQAAPIYRLFHRVYYISQNYEPGDGIPTLKRIDFKGAPIPIAAGIERMHLQYGLDMSGDGEPDLYAAAETLDAADWREIVAVRIHILARNQQATHGYQDARTYLLGEEEVGPFYDDFRRQAYSTTVRMNNVAGPREQ
ncbi:type IV pilus assembly protein PilW [Thiocapsa roseopersicina]|uniref:Type IV pilus assembly protein PilW n=2 Tax=Thiocapsa roseopersicina TaxID=1058 RepID=A0A1H2Z341_THIRO|nr:type IV pilus assembly protein PilW [Thiocapsa roseopersicina]